jgi:hypothetical protein
MGETETVGDLMSTIARTNIGENFLNRKLYALVPQVKAGAANPSFNQYLPTISQYGGVTSAQQDNIFNMAQQNGRFNYDADYINYHTLIKNLKSFNL